MRRVIYSNFMYYRISPCKDCPHKAAEPTLVPPINITHLEVICKLDECKENLTAFERDEDIKIKQESFP